MEATSNKNVSVYCKCFRLLFGNIINRPEKMEKIIHLIVILSITMGVATCSAQKQRSGLTVTKVTRSKVGSALTIDGRWGTFINGKSYQQMPVDTYKGWQYVTCYDPQRHVCIGRRKLPDGAWELIHFTDYLFGGNDNHNVAVLGISHGDGTIHLAFDHHGEPLNYRVSQPGAATDPDNTQWNASLFSDVRDWLKQGEHLSNVTYPRFVPTPQGGLLFVSRNGASQNGKITFAEYKPDGGGWSRRRDVTSNQGMYVFGDKEFDHRNAYLNGVHYRKGSKRLHMSWCWREALARMHDLNYAYSDDNGRNWFNSAGRQIGSPGQLISVNSPGLVAWEITPDQGLDNQQGQYVDDLDRPHICVWHLLNGETSKDRDPANSAYYHYWRDETGLWRQNKIFSPVGGGEDEQRNRPKILSTSDNDLIAMFNNKERIVLVSATAENQYRDWSVIHVEEGPWDGEPLPDLNRWREEGVLSIYMQKNPSKNGEPTDLYVVDFSFAATGKNK